MAAQKIGVVSKKPLGPQSSIPTRIGPKKVAPPLNFSHTEKRRKIRDGAAHEMCFPDPALKIP